MAGVAQQRYFASGAPPDRVTYFFKPGARGGAQLDAK
jgi:hypothetical protein